MRCRRCKRENPPGRSRCVCCGYPLARESEGRDPRANRPNGGSRNMRRDARHGGSRNVRRGMQQGGGHNMQHGGRRKRDAAETAIIAIICVLIAALIAVSCVGLYSHTHSMGRRGYIVGSGGGGGGGGSAAVNTLPPAQTSDRDVTADGSDPDVEIYSFSSDTLDIEVGTTEQVTFTAEIFVNIELGDTDVSVIDSAGNVIGYMNDRGENGDAAANDGEYTLVTDLTSNMRKSLVCSARAKNTRSDPVEIYFFTPISVADHELCRGVIAEVRQLNEANAIKQYLNGNTAVASCQSSEDNAVITFTMNSGIKCVWEKARENGTKGAAAVVAYDEYSGNLGTLSYKTIHGKDIVSVVRPYRGTEFQYDDFKDAGNAIANAFGGDMVCYDDGRASLDAFKSFDGSGVILVDSHGTIVDRTSDDKDPYIITGSVYEGSGGVHDADWQAERIIVLANDGRIGVGGGFFDRYYTAHSLDGSVFYLGTCYSMYDNTISDALIRKGAEVVYGFSDSVGVGYCNDVLHELMETQLVANMNNARTAYTNTKNIHGDYRTLCEFRMAGNDDFVLVTDRGRGTLSGMVTDASSGALINGALVRVYHEGRQVASGRTDADGCYSLTLPEGDYVIKITYGRYKTAKAEVTITPDIVTYVETVLLLDVGLNDGYANGVITNAVSGEPVDGVSIKLRKSWNNRTGAVLQELSTNGSGYYEISYAPGLYTMEYSKEGYITGYKNIVIGVLDIAAQNAAISPELPDDGEFRIVLSWSRKPHDLDSHLTGPEPDGSRFHLYYINANTRGGSMNPDYYQLDLDNTDIESRPDVPETTTILTQIDGVYRYSVHDYSNGGSRNSTELSESNATVNVYKGSVLVATYHVPPNTGGTIWTVFELSGDTITPINTMKYGYADDDSAF